MSRQYERFEKTIRLAACRSDAYMSHCRGAHTGNIDSRTEQLYGGRIAKDQCVQAYTAETPLYKHVNAGLTDDDGSSLLMNAEFVYHAREQLKQLWGAGRRFEGEVWRWADLTAGDITEFYRGKEFLWPPFVSTSKTKDTIFQTRSALFQIDCDGLGTTYAVDVSGISSFPQEQEILLYPYCGFVVLDVDHIYHGGTCKPLIRLRVKDKHRVEG